MNVSLLEAWRLWFSGKPLAGTYLWGLSFTWWGRIGKILEFVAAYGVIVEIAGPTRLRKYGESLRHLVPRSTMADTFRSTGGYFLAMLALVLADPLDYSGEQYGRLLEEPARQFGRIDKLNYLVALILTAPIIIWFALGKFSWIGRGGEEVLSLAVSAVAIYSACFGIVGPLLTFVFLGLLNIIGFVVDAVFFRGMANVLEYKKLDKAVRIGSLVVIAVGFHFDLLTS